MELTQAINLISHPNLAQAGIRLAQAGIRVWADLGSGSGLFTYALAALLPAGSVIYAIDKNKLVMSQHPKPASTIIHQQQGDFIRQALNLPSLDGILMANSLHYVEDKVALIHTLSKYFKEQGSFLIVEYNTDIANRWVPYPISFNTLKSVFKQTGYTKVEKLQEIPSLYRRANLYAALINS